MNNQPGMVRPALINLNPDCPFIISMNRCYGRCNTAEDPFGRICFPNKMEEVNLKVFNMIKELNESIALAKKRV